MKKFGLFCLCLASLGLVGCFHVPDEDWLPSRNKINSGDTQKDKEMEDALNDIMDGINMVSSQRDQLNNYESDEIIKDEESEAISKNETVTNNNEEILNDEKNLNEEDTTSEEILDEKESNNSGDIIDIQNTNQETKENIISEE